MPAAPSSTAQQQPTHHPRALSRHAQQLMRKRPGIRQRCLEEISGELSKGPVATSQCLNMLYQACQLWVSREEADLAAQAMLMEMLLRHEVTGTSPRGYTSKWPQMIHGVGESITRPSIKRPNSISTLRPAILEEAQQTIQTASHGKPIHRSRALKLIEKRIRLIGGDMEEARRCLIKLEEEGQLKGVGKREGKLYSSYCSHQAVQPEVSR